MGLAVLTSCGWDPCPALALLPEPYWDWSVPLLLLLLASGCGLLGPTPPRAPAPPPLECIIEAEALGRVLWVKTAP